MKRRRFVIVAVAAFALVGAGAAVAWFASGRGAKRAPEAAPEYRYRPLKTICAHLAMLEKPDAKRAAVLSADADLRASFGHAGLKVAPESTNAAPVAASLPAGRFDIVYAEGASADWTALVGRVSESGVAAWALDVRRMTAADFKRALESFPCAEVHFWMVGERDWLLVGRRSPRKLKLSAMLDMFSREGSFEDLAKAECETLPDLFASYVGTREDVLPAFVGDLSAPVLPEFFVSRKLPPIDWIVPGDVDDDIYDAVASEIRSKQNIRRTIVEGNMLALQAGKIDEAISKWAGAALMNPHDPMLLDRLYRLAVNAKAFEKLGNLKGAAKCYETMVSVRPTDTAAMLRYAECMRLLGQKEISERAVKRAKELMK